MRHPPPHLSGPVLRELFTQRGVESGVWRFVEMVLPGATHPVSFPEGNTPLLRRAALSAYAGIEDVAFKHEGMNPTGSFKDRGMTVGMTQAARCGAKAVACASTGNTSASLAAYAALAGLPAYVLVPAGKIAMGKLAQAVGFGARVLAVRGDFDACMKLVREASHQLSLYLLNSVNPFRLEGQKTIVLEVLVNRGWDPPDWIVLPGGNLGNVSAFGKGLMEARAAGMIGKLPRLAVIQAEGASPFAQSFRNGFAERLRVRAETVASAIRIGDPASWDRAETAIRSTNGVVTSVSDAEILAAHDAINRAAVGSEPASAASLAGLRQLVAKGTVAKGASVVAVLTGHMLKDTEQLMTGAQIREIEPDIVALEKELGRRR